MHLGADPGADRALLGSSNNPPSSLSPIILIFPRSPPSSSSLPLIQSSRRKHPGGRIFGGFVLLDWSDRVAGWLRTALRAKRTGWPDRKMAKAPPPVTAANKGRVKTSRKTMIYGLSLMMRLPSVHPSTILPSLSSPFLLIIIFPLPLLRPRRERIIDREENRIVELRREEKKFSSSRRFGKGKSSGILREDTTTSASSSPARPRSKSDAVSGLFKV